MRSNPQLRRRLVGAIATLATFVAFSAAPASAQTCPYNSTQGTCACPTAGAGTTCFGGQLYRASDNSCQNDARPCAANQNWNCSTTSCVCNTASFPCGGCTAVSSSPGASCSGNPSCPTSGTYTNQCSTVGCPAGTTICPTPAPGACVTNRTCPAGTTWDVCTDTCGTPNVLLSPSWVQGGYIQINGDLKSTAGNLRLDSATGANQGDLYVANGKAIRVDGTGVTNINVGNWGAGGTGVDVNFPATSRICFGATCRNSWPSTTDFNPTYINATGDTMTGDLNLTGASTDLFVAGNVGIGTTTPVDGRLEVVRASTSFRANMVFGTGANNDWEIGELNTDGSFTFKRITAQPVTGAAIMTFDVNDRVGIGTASPAEALDVFGTVKSTGLQLTTGAGAGRYLVSDASGNASWSTAALIGGSGTTNYLPKFTAASTLGNSLVYDNGTNVAIGTTSPGAKFQVNDGSVLFTGTTGTLPATGAGTRLVWYPGKSALRAGIVSGPNWDDVNIGTSSAAVGADTRAGNYSFAAGNYSYATGTGSAAFGQSSGASGDYSLAAGYSTTSGGLYSAAFGYASSAGGTMSFASGQGNASGAGSVAMGQYTNAANSYAQAYGSFTEANGYKSVVLGNGFDGTAAGKLINNTGYAIMLGTHSSLPTMTVYNGSPGIGTTGKVGIGLGATMPTDKLAVVGNDVTSQSVISAKSNSVSAAGNLFYGEINNNNVSNTDFLEFQSGTTLTEKLRVSGSGQWILRPTNSGTNGSLWIMLGTLANGFGNPSALDLQFTDSTTGTGGYTALKVSAGFGGSGTGTKRLADFNAGANGVVIDKDGKVGIGGATPAVKLTVGGNGTDVYATDAWIEDNMHVQGNETLAQGGRGRMRVGTAWNYVGLYADGSSTGANNDLVLGATSGTVRVGPNAGGQNLRVSGGIGTGDLDPVAGYGIYSQGSTMGGRFMDSNGSGYAYAGYGDSGVRGYGNSYGLYGYDLDDYVYGYVGYAGYSFYGSGVFNNYGDVRLDGKHAFRGSDSWLRLNQDGSFSSGVYTPGTFRTDGNVYFYGTIQTNYYVNWYTADAWNGGSAQGSTGLSTSNVLCALQKVHNTGAGGRCESWQGGDGYWWRGAYANGGTSGVYCAWHCFKYR